MFVISRQNGTLHTKTTGSTIRRTLSSESATAPPPLRYETSAITKSQDVDDSAAVSCEALVPVQGADIDARLVRRNCNEGTELEIDEWEEAMAREVDDEDWAGRWEEWFYEDFCWHRVGESYGAEEEWREVERSR